MIIYKVSVKKCDWHCVVDNENI